MLAKANNHHVVVILDGCTPFSAIDHGVFSAYKAKLRAAQQIRFWTEEAQGEDFGIIEERSRLVRTIQQAWWEGTTPENLREACVHVGLASIFDPAVPTISCWTKTVSCPDVTSN